MIANYKKWILLIIIAASIITITLVLITNRFNSKTDFTAKPSRLLNNYTIKIDNKGFDKLCTGLLNSKYKIEIEQIVFSETRSSCTFYKIFETSFFKKLFGFKSIIFKGSIKINFDKNTTLNYESYWIERYSNDRSKYVKATKYKDLLNEDLLISEIKKWK